LVQLAQRARGDFKGRSPLALLERILLGEILSALCVLAVNAGQLFHREGAKDAKKRQGD
jgi:hypothetical protein